MSNAAVQLQTLHQIALILTPSVTSQITSLCIDIPIQIKAVTKVFKPKTKYRPMTIHDYICASLYFIWY